MQLKGEQSPVIGVTRYLVIVANEQQCALFVVFASRIYFVTRLFCHESVCCTGSSVRMFRPEKTEVLAKNTGKSI